MIDSHCHLDCDAFDGDREAVLARAATAGVTDIVVPAVDERTWAPILALAARAGAPRCHAALGIHPVAVPALDPREDDPTLDRLASYLRASGPIAVGPVAVGPIAVGECGLDTTIDLTRAPLDRQERIFRRQIALSCETKLPLVLHARGPGAWSRMLEVLRCAPAGWSGVLHSYGGGAEMLQGFLALPLVFGFAGPVTWARARKVVASAAAVPAGRLLAETDAPDQTPEPHRPGRSEPAYLREIVAGLASARGVSPESVGALTAANARRVFGFG